MEVRIRSFQDLSPEELYEILSLRSEVFVVEQNCVYQDIDQKDQNALHVLGLKEGRILAYCRCFKPGDYFKEAAIGRVLVKKEERGSSFGHEILSASIKAVQEKYNVSEIKLSAQQYLTSFYEAHGFNQTGEPYLEDGIPHIAMIKKE